MATGWLGLAGIEHRHEKPVGELACQGTKARRTPTSHEAAPGGGQWWCWQVPNDLALSRPDLAVPKQLSLGWAEVVDHGVLYE